jgi:hypothetical protein
MNRLIVACSCAAVLACGAMLSAQQVILPSAPAKGFGASITGAYEGWYDNADGTHVFLVGYYNRNINQDVDVPIGPNNRIEPGGPDMGQPTHFVKGRQVGVFSITVPKAFPKDQRLVWTIVVNGQTMQIPLRMHTDYNVSPFKDAAVGNVPPIVHLFTENAPAIQGPLAQLSTAIAKTAKVGTALELPVWTSDDAKYTSGTNAPLRNPPPPVSLTWAPFRGPAAVKIENPKPKLEVLKGGQVDEPYAAKGTSSATFAEPGEYVLELTANDFSGNGGGGEVCCWTSAMVKVTVTP